MTANGAALDSASIASLRIFPSSKPRTARCARAKGSPTKVLEGGERLQ